MTDAELSNRLERLERENRWMRRVGFAVVVVAMAVALIGAAKPEEIPEMIEARMFRVIDEKGSPRAQMDANGLRYADENGKTRAQMNADGFVNVDENGKTRAQMNADGFVNVDENGKPRAAMTANGLSYADENGKTRAQMNADGFVYADETGKHRAQFGVVEVVTPKTGEESRYPAGMALFDANGKVIWEAPN
ncbi:MAG: hypothetical protein GY769_03295 [bacterium]|nr:hypothetical protein [bacterium]